MIDKALLERFKSHVAFLDDSDDSCWIWTGALTDGGRGRFFIGHRGYVPAHRMAWEFLNGKPVPKDRRLVQVCKHPQCVRHWRVGGRRLSRSERFRIRESLESVRRIAGKYGISKTYVSLLRRVPYLLDGSK